jgi:hypothetical protein
MLIKRTNTSKKWKIVKNNNKIDFRPMIYGQMIDFNTDPDDDANLCNISTILVKNFDSNNISHVRRHSKLFPYNF